MINAIIIDDEQNNIDNLAFLLRKKCGNVHIVATALDVVNGQKLIEQFRPNLVFLDIQMPGGTGFDMLKSLPLRAFEVIFVTAYDQYAIQAIKVSAVDYLLKPINSEDLKQAVKKATEKINGRKQNHPLENLVNFLQNQHNKEEHRIALPTLKETRFVVIRNILRCESNNNYTTFFLADHEKILVAKPIYEYEETLNGYGFVRCHQSHLVNVRFVRSWVKTDGGYLLLEGGSQIPVSKNKKEDVKAALES
ncbi:MAG TPA: LytTR family DNA-binding domain-containing protein [Panacibacter sp.]|nr:LytTR family DNA-binding domain-containing protein [Panacibacter sp.]HNP44170.1 LytTR family DNA-binding domain-containing protein [Panacibacter sp.]